MGTYILFRRQFVSLWNQKFRFFFRLFVPIFVFLFLLLIFNLVSMEREPTLLARENFQFGTGLIFLTTITNSFSLTVVQIQDNINNTINDIKVTPIKHWKIRYSYFLFNFAINFITTLFVFMIFIIFVIGFDYSQIVNILNSSKVSLSFLLMVFGTLFGSLIFPILLSRLKSLTLYQALNIMVFLFGGYLIGSFFPLSYYPAWLRSFCSIIPSTHLLQVTRHTFYLGTLNEASNLVLNPISLFNYNISVASSLIYVSLWVLSLFWINIFLDKIILGWNRVKKYLKEYFKKSLKEQ
ncbi:ABC-2 type transporter permease [[Mycoplasma] cavipharyngis]|uniref:ABC transporter permease n=1 Tax=[Mycoplasma] cavipharyngis TaxID=92757 RepID=UPI00370451D3